jgi:pimeloyl-ACP methyl ester carboxylesterase
MCDPNIIRAGLTVGLAGLLAVACATMQAAPGAGGAVEAQADAVRSAVSKDGTRIAYDVRGAGPALMLLHSAGQTRAEWDAIGYVGALAERFTVIRVDLRGAGDSGKPTNPAAYAVDRVLEDLLAVADAAKAERFHVWGYGRGAIIARYLAAQSDRVLSMVYVGVPFGPPGACTPSGSRTSRPAGKGASARCD